MKKGILCMLALLLLAGCRPAPVLHDANKAVEDANAALKLLYFTHDYEGARKLLDGEFTFFHSSANLQESVEKMEGGYGKLKVLTAEAYTPFAAGNVLILYYKGQNEKSTTYHQITMKGNAQNGYKVYGINITYEEFKDEKKVKFEKVVVLK